VKQSRRRRKNNVVIAMDGFLGSATAKPACVTSSATYGMILADNLID
jgi:hypothetical protein